MSHSINKDQYHERFHPPVPQHEHIASADAAEAANVSLSLKSAAKAAKASAKADE